ncbi:hypothetical protein SXCC_00560 [Gluconacetobacter sp. SXCC-1]|nr:hypothetical protein SXCC_00560 [Gluconacetobacter sp. SXCC-1]
MGCRFTLMIKFNTGASEYSGCSCCLGIHINEKNASSQ